MIKVESGSDSITLFFKNRPVLKVSTQQPFIEKSTNASGESYSSQEKEPEGGENGSSSCHDFQLIE
ncbi:MAG: hypothetical protein HN580_02840 [Deltaproteobacteria bacterium]|nr:hypothetical protein [Deltaproteobacteria bacterium]MBT7710426.1 hypothetical protein [Deltaproteobacteria bacterium]MBT7887931.1 hypothetical protein [Deltaproteobacteria bacterium]